MHIPPIHLIADSNHSMMLCDIIGKDNFGYIRGNSELNIATQHREKFKIHIIDKDVYKFPEKIDARLRQIQICNDDYCFIYEPLLEYIIANPIFANVKYEIFKSKRKIKDDLSILVKKLNLHVIDQVRFER